MARPPPDPSRGLRTIRAVTLPSGPFVGVALDLPMDTLFTYRVPDPWRGRVQIGQRVRVPFRNKHLVGLVAEVSDACTLKRVLDVESFPDDEPLLPPSLLSLGKFVASYYGSSVGEAYAAMIPRGVRTRNKGATRKRARLLKPEKDAVAHADGLPTALNAQARVLRLLAKEPNGVLLQDLVRRAKVSSSPVRTLATAGWLTLDEESATDDPLVEATRSPISEPQPTDLHPAQAKAIDAVVAALNRRQFAPFLLLGVTGSGKTEVYLRAIAACRTQGRQAVVLVPEIALTPQTVRRFRARFDRVAVLHSGMSEADRAASWRAIRAGDADVVIGPRSAVFAPVPDLGLLILDEEHETSFKQQNAPRYHARDVGLVRARESNAVVILGSATPSLESYRNALDGKFGLLELPERVENRPLPPVRIVDLKADGERRGEGRQIGRTLMGRLRAALAAGDQAILFLNRRGFSTSVACPRCGFVVRCPECDTALTYHRSDAVSLCHLCGHEDRPPKQCPECAFPSLKHRGAGTETIEQELATEFPDVAVARMDSDTMTDRDAYTDVLDRFGRGEVKILLGTQMIAKGLHFPGVTLVGVISADTSLQLADFRAAERTFALLAQVAGRTGRGDAGGEVIVQTLRPNEPAIRRAMEHAYALFATDELAERKAFGYPPYRRLLRVVLRGAATEPVLERGRELARRLDAAGLAGVEWLGPATPQIARLQGFHRRHILIKAVAPSGIRRALDAMRASPGPKNGVEEQYDVDPVGLL